MKFDLNKPCKTCPFLRANQPAIPDCVSLELKSHDGIYCVQTVEVKFGLPVLTSYSQHCAGAAIILEKIGRPNAKMEAGAKSGAYRAEELQNADLVFGDFEEMKEGAANGATKVQG